MKPDQPIRLVAIDLDDTLLDHSNEISSRCAQAITAAVKKGVVVTLATGRMFCSARPYAQQLGMDVPLITYNGALICAALSGQEIFHQPIETAVAQQILHYFQEKQIYIQAYVHDQLYVDKINEHATWYMQHARVSAEAIGDKLYDLNEAPTKLLAVTAPDQVAAYIAEVEQTFGQHVFATNSKPGFVEIMDRRVSKGQALAALAQQLGIAQQQVMAIGDSHNDIAMLRWAGFGVAMANGSAEVKAAAQAVTVSNNEDGVAAALETYVL